MDEDEGSRGETAAPDLTEHVWNAEESVGAAPHAANSKTGLWVHGALHYTTLHYTTLHYTTRGGAGAAASALSARPAL